MLKKGNRGVNLGASNPEALWLQVDVGASNNGSQEAN